MGNLLRWEIKNELKILPLQGVIYISLTYPRRYFVTSLWLGKEGGLSWFSLCATLPLGKYVYALSGYF